MSERITEDQPRIKFNAKRTGHLILPTNVAELDALCALQDRMVAEGVIPILEDGFLAGNCAITARAAGISSSAAARSGAAPAPHEVLVSQSGKRPGAAMRSSDFALVESFDRSTWSATYLSASEEARPSSDAPLHFHAIAADCCARYGWGEAPAVAVHGHALAEGPGLDAALRAGLPVSHEATLFSTPDDLAALEQLFREHPYPGSCCFIRRGHGFFILGSSVAAAESAFERLVLPLIPKRRILVIIDSM